MAPLLLLRAASRSVPSASSSLAQSIRPASNLAKAAPTKRSSAAKARPSPNPAVLDEYGTERKPLPPLSPLPASRKGGVAARSTPLKKADAAPRRAPSQTKKGAAPPSPSPPPPTSSEALAALEPLSPSTATPLELSVRRDLARFPDCILLTQVGMFYESYFDQAPTVARVLGIKLTSKQFGKGDAKRREPFCGFPITQIEPHTSTLVEAGHRVVIVDEYKEEGSEETKRKVVRVATVGTGVDEGFVKQDRMNFVLAVGVSDAGLVDLAWRDVSNGAYFSSQCTLETLRDTILFVEPREVVVSSDLKSVPAGEAVLALLLSEEEREPWCISLSKDALPTSNAQDVLGAYLASTLLATPPPKTAPTVVVPSKILLMDSTTLKSLEIRESLRGGVQGSLVSTVRRTVTPGGARLLAERLCSPSTELPIINHRLSLVSAFITLSGTRQYLRALLKPLPDSSRLLQRLFLQRGKATDLTNLAKIFRAVVEARQTLEDEFEDGVVGDEREALQVLVGRMGEHGALAMKIEEAIDEDALMKRVVRGERKAELEESLGVGVLEKMDEVDGEFSEGLWGQNGEWVIKPGFAPEFVALHEKLSALRRTASELESTLRALYDNRSLQLKTMPRYGPVVHVGLKSGSGTGRLDADASATVLSKSGSTRSYSVGAWTSLFAQIRDVTKEIESLENKTISSLVTQVQADHESLQQTAAALDELDLSLSFAELALEMELVRPTVNEGTSLSIVEGRHPTVAHALKMKGRGFKANSVDMSHPGAFLYCLTGPNMAGKSTFLRQNALIVILAQAGSFVPADSVEMGVVDRVFSRVGARDELDRGRSTFFIEMDEATSILKNATNRSLVLLDELGRGTSPLDGLAIAYAALEHLVNVNRSRTLFATHYHRLGELMGYDDANPRGEGPWEGVEFWCSDVHEVVVEGKVKVDYSHKLRRGLNDDSAGIYIAQMAGMPDRAIKVAQEVRARYRPQKSSE